MITVEETTEEKKSMINQKSDNCLWLLDKNKVEFVLIICNF